MQITKLEQSDQGKKLITDARSLAIREIEKYGAPGRVHFSLAERKAIELAQQLNADALVVRVGIALMDLHLGQAMQENRLDEHVAMSVTATEKFLNAHDIDDPTKMKIINCVAAHHRDVPFTCIEAEICANADCYRFIHPAGFFYFLTILGKRGQDYLSCISAAESKLEEKHKILSLETCQNELEPYYKTLKQYIIDARKLAE